MERLYEIDQSESVAFNLNLQHVMDYSEALYRKIICYPAVSFYVSSAAILFNKYFPNLWNIQK